MIALMALTGIYVFFPKIFSFRGVMQYQASLLKKKSTGFSLYSTNMWKSFSKIKFSGIWLENGIKVLKRMDANGKLVTLLAASWI